MSICFLLPLCMMLIGCVVYTQIASKAVYIKKSRESYALRLCKLLETGNIEISRVQSMNVTEGYMPDPARAGGVFGMVSRIYNQDTVRKSYEEKKTYTLVLSKDHQLIEYSLPHMYRPVIFQKRKLTCEYNIYGSAALQVDPGGDNIFHWFNEAF